MYPISWARNFYCSVFPKKSAAYVHDVCTELVAAQVMRFKLYRVCGPLLIFAKMKSSGLDLPHSIAKLPPNINSGARNLLAIRSYLGA